MSILDFLKILLKTEGFSGAVVGLIAVILAYLKVPQEITAAVLGVIAVLMIALTTYLTAARIRARMW